MESPQGEEQLRHSTEHQSIHEHSQENDERGGDEFFHCAGSDLPRVDCDLGGVEDEEVLL